MGKKLTLEERLALLKEPIIELCQTGGEGKKCSRIEEDTVNGKTALYCKAYAFPTAKWRNGICNLADHLEIKAVNKEKVRVGQQKQKKNK